MHEGGPGFQHVQFSPRRLGLCRLALALMAALLLPNHTTPAQQATGGGGPPRLMVRIPGGAAWLGSDDAEKGFGYAMGGPAAWRGRWFQGETRRRVNLPPFWMDETLVTQAQYAEFVQATGRAAPFITPAQYREQGFLVHPYASVRPYLWDGGRPPPDKAQHPVVLVSQQDAAAYCAWRGPLGATPADNAGASQRGQKENIRCGLPDEDQWELAARGTDGRYFPWGSTWRPALLNSAEAGPFGTTPVRQYPAGRSPFGLYDMAGNVFQWTSAQSPDGRAILKGCSWDDAAGICRGAARHARPAPSRHILIGFRCTCQ